MREGTLNLTNTRKVMQAAVWDAMTDLYAILPIGRDKRGRGIPLLRKRKRPTGPGLVGAALERAVDGFVRRVGAAGLGRGRSV